MSWILLRPYQENLTGSKNIVYISNRTNLVLMEIQRQMTIRMKTLRQEINTSVTKRNLEVKEKTPIALAWHSAI